MTQELSKEELQIINDGLARRRSKTVEAQGKGQELALQWLTGKCVREGFYIREMSAMNLLPNVSLIVLKLEELDEIPKETLDHLWLKGVSTVFWTEADGGKKEDCEVLQWPSEEDWLPGDRPMRTEIQFPRVGTSFLTALCTKPKAVVANLAAKDVYKLVTVLEDKKGPVLYLGKENKDCPAMACAAVAISDPDGTEAAKTCSSIIGIQGLPSTLKNFPKIRALTKQARDEPIKAVGCLKYYCLRMFVKRRQNPMAQQIDAANDSSV
jgi:hypothetical protein